MAGQRRRVDEIPADQRRAASQQRDLPNRPWNSALRQDGSTGPAPST
jgi:hypothetical protein